MKPYCVTIQMKATKQCFHMTSLAFDYQLQNKTLADFNRTWQLLGVTVVNTGI